MNFVSLEDDLSILLWVNNVNMDFIHLLFKIIYVIIVT